MGMFATSEISSEHQILGSPKWGTDRTGSLGKAD